MLHGHSNRVNCVQWVVPRSGHAQYTTEDRASVEIASGSVDNSVIVWRKEEADTVTVCLDTENEEICSLTAVTV